MSGGGSIGDTRRSSRMLLGGDNDENGIKWDGEGAEWLIRCDTHTTRSLSIWVAA